MTQSETFVIYVQPRASRTEVVGPYGDAVKIRLRSPPVDGAANDELIRFLAKRLGVGRQEVHLVGGATQRRKRIVVDGMSVQEVISRLLD